MFALSNSGNDVLVELDAVYELRCNALQVLHDLVVHLLRVDGDLFDLRAEDVAHQPARETRLAVNQRGRADEMRLPLDLLPLADERRQLALEGLLGDVFADRADDDAAGVLRQDRFDLGAQSLARLALADLSAHAHSLGERHVDEEPAGHRDLRGDARALGRDRFLGDLDDQVLAALEDVLDRRRFRAAPASAATTPPPPPALGVPPSPSGLCRRPHHRRRRHHRPAHLLERRDRTRAGTRFFPCLCRRTLLEFQEGPPLLVRGRCRRPCGAPRDDRPEVQRAGRPR